MYSAISCATRTSELSTFASSICEDGGDQGTSLVKVGVQFQDLSEIMDTWQTTGVRLQDVVQGEYKTVVFTCASDSSSLSFGRFELE